MQQANLEASIKRAVSGISLSACHANAKTSDWTGLAQAAVKFAIAALPQDAKFTIEDVRATIDEELPAPPDLRAWGSVTQSLIKSGSLVKTHSYKQAASSNGSPKMLYAKGI